MQRYFVNDEQWIKDEVIITDDDYHHMTRVMRMKIGDKVICNHPTGKSATCQINAINDKEVMLTVIDYLDETTELPVKVTIAQGLPKRDKLEFVLQKGTELGASRFLPFEAARSVTKWNKKKGKSRLKRFRKIVKEASEQSHRQLLPEVDEPKSIAQLIEASDGYDVKIVAYEEEAKTNELKTAFDSLGHGDKMIVCIGPEGGFSKDEIELLKEHGFQSVRLGPRILRTETASLYVLASLSYHFEE